MVRSSSTTGKMHASTRRAKGKQAHGDAAFLQPAFGSSSLVGDACTRGLMRFLGAYRYAYDRTRLACLPRHLGKLIKIVDVEHSGFIEPRDLRIFALD